MPSLLKTGRLMTSIGFTGILLLQLYYKSWLIGRPAASPFSVQVVYACTLIGFVLVLGFGQLLFTTKYARIAAFLFGCMVLVLSFFIRHLPEMIHKDSEGILWQLNAYKTLALAGGCWIIAASLPGWPAWISNKVLVITGWITMAIWLIIAGAAHIKFNRFVQDLIPAYIPAHAFWSYFTAVALLAGGIGLLVNPLRQWAALLAGLMILLWFFLLHIPRGAAHPKDVQEWLGVCESFIFSGILFVLSSLSRKQTS